MAKSIAPRTFGAYTTDSKNPMKDQHGNEIVVGAVQDQPVPPAPPSTPAPSVPAVSFKAKLAAWWHIFWVRKQYSLPVMSLTVLFLIVLIPFTRYPALGLFLQQEYSVRVTDTTSGKPVSAAQVKLGSVQGVTNTDGEVTLKTKVGRNKLFIEKNYYETVEQSVTVPVTRTPGVFKPVAIRATGRQVPVSVSNKISGQPVASVTIKAADTEVSTTEDGMATIVLPATGESFEAELSGESIVSSSVKITVGDTLLPENQFSVTPKGKLYFLSKQSGKIDVVKTNLDGSERQTVLAGTGKEDEGQTVLLASRDWRYLALHSRRDGGTYAKLFLIDTQNNDAVTVMDEGEATFTLYGWADHHFAYKVDRQNVQTWVIKKYALKAYDADNKKIVLLDETQAFGDSQNYVDEQYLWVHLLGSDVVFFKAWTAHKNFYALSFPELSVRQSRIGAIQVNGSSRRDIKTFAIAESLGNPTTYYQPYGSGQSVVYEPGEIYFSVYPYGSEVQYFETTTTQAEESASAKEFFQLGKSYPTYLASPDGKRSFWSESRDGKTALILGDEHGENERVIASLSEFTQYGWFTDDYLLLAKNASELYILPVDGGQPFKVSDYHKPYYDYFGYGGGYGGL